METIKITKDAIKSNQLNSLGLPMIDLIRNDIVELREDGIYFIRKIDFLRNKNMFSSAFESIKSENNS